MAQRMVQTDLDSSVLAGQHCGPGHARGPPLQLVPSQMQLCGGLHFPPNEQRRIG